MSKHHDILEIVARIIKIYLKLFQLELKTAVNTYLFKTLVLASLILGLTLCICLLTGLILVIFFHENYRSKLLEQSYSDLDFIYFVGLVTGQDSNFFQRRIKTKTDLVCRFYILAAF